MDYTETWSVIKMTKRPTLFEYENIISEVTWKLQICQGALVWERSGLTTLGLPSEPVVPFQDLTEQQVIEWVKQMLTPEYITELRAQAAKWLLEQQGFTSTIVTQMPWASINS